MPSTDQQKNKQAQTNLEDFRQLVYFWIKQIPKGKVASYGQIAKLAGFPRHARHVSKALGAADKTMKLPWQRVIAASGKIAFRPDSDSFARQQVLLEKEGVKVVKGKINLQQFGWQPVSTINHQQAGDISAEEFFK